METLAVIVQTCRSEEWPSKLRNLIDYVKNHEHALFHYPQKRSEIIKIYIKKTLQIPDDLLSDSYMLEASEIKALEDLECGFQISSHRGLFEYGIGTSFSVSESLNLLEKWMTRHHICFLEFIQTLGQCIKNHIPLEMVGCSDAEKKYYFGCLMRSFRVKVIDERYFTGIYHANPVDVLWVEGDDYRNISLFPIYIGEICPNKSYKKRRHCVDLRAPLKFIFCRSPSFVFPNIHFESNDHALSFAKPLHPQTWLYALHEVKEHMNPSLFPSDCLSLQSLIECTHTQHVKDNQEEQAQLQPQVQPEAQAQPQTSHEQSPQRQETEITLGSIQVIKPQETESSTVTHQLYQDGNNNAHIQISIDQDGVNFPQQTTEPVQNPTLCNNLDTNWTWTDVMNTILQQSRDNELTVLNVSPTDFNACKEQQIHFQ